MSTPAAPYNYAIDAVQRSGGSAPQNMFAPAKADNLPTSIICAPVSVDISSSTFTLLPVSVFSAGSGVYSLFCNGPGAYDLCSTGSLVITAGVITASSGFATTNIVGGTSLVGGGAITLNYTSLSGGGAPGIFQTSGADQTYVCQAIKIAN